MHDLLGSGFLAAIVHWGGWKWTGNFTTIDLVAEVPAALTNPAYITLCLAAGVVGYFLAFAKGQLFREGLFQFMTAFSLPWYAIAGAQKGVWRSACRSSGCCSWPWSARLPAATTSISPAACPPSSSCAASGS
jgi:uncharacterized membrane protein YeiH